MALSLSKCKILLTVILKHSDSETIEVMHSQQVVIHNILWGQIILSMVHCSNTARKLKYSTWQQCNGLMINQWRSFKVRLIILSPRKKSMWHTASVKLLFRVAQPNVYFRGIYHYSTTHTSDAVFIIGGHDTNNIVAEFRDNQWQQIATLNRGRSQHGSISLGLLTVIIGGETTDEHSFYTGK